ncbi:p-hydroxyphenylacetate 3-hydroxylase, reductase component [compost metagenome]
MLMVLENDAGLGLWDLQREVAMPRREIEEAVANLKRKGMVADAEERYVLTPAGVEQAEALWRIAREQQEKVFASFSEEQVETFKQMLKAVIALG